MNLTQNIMKQLRVFPIIKKEQLYRLVNSYSLTSKKKFDIEFSYLVTKGLIKVGHDRYEGVVYNAMQ